MQLESPLNRLDTNEFGQVISLFTVFVHAPLNDDSGGAQFSHVRTLEVGTSSALDFCDFLL